MLGTLRLTDARDRTNGIYVFQPCFRFDLKTSDQCLVGRLHVRLDVDTMSDPRKS